MSRDRKIKWSSDFVVYKNAESGNTVLILIGLGGRGFFVKLLF